MRDLFKLLRESLPEIIGGLIVAGLLAAIGAVYAGLGIWPTVLVLLLVAASVGGLCIILARRRPDVSQQSSPETPTASRPSSERICGAVPKRNQSILFVDDDIRVVAQ
jgi:uncharacterized membrane protein